MIRKTLFIICLFLSLLANAQEYEYTYKIFDNSPMPGSWFFSRASGSGGSSLKAVNGRLPVSEAVFHTPGNSLELEYREEVGGNWQATIYHEDLRGIDHYRKTAFLSLWAYSSSETNMPRLQLMISDSSLSGVATLPGLKGKGWQHFVVPMYQFKAKLVYDPSNIIGVVFSQDSSSTNKAPHKLYIDDIEFLPSSTAVAVAQAPKISGVKGYAMHVDVSWDKLKDETIHLVKIYRSEDGVNYRAVGIQQPYINRYTDFTGETGKDYSYKISFLNSYYQETALSAPLPASTVPMTDDELLTMVQEACFRYYWEGAEPNSGMAREDIPGRQDMIATGASGFGIMALIVGTERNFITREESADRFLKILAFLEKADRFHGVYGHFMDGPTGKELPFFGGEDNGADLVETSFLLQGLLAARQYFNGDNDKEKMIREKITGIWESAEFDWFRKDQGSRYLYWHWSPDQGWVINHRLVGWNETMIVYLLAISSPTHAVPPEMYYSGWASQDKTGRNYRMNWGGSEEGSMYTNGNSYFGIMLDVGVNNGGPLFFTHYSYMGFDPHSLTDKYTNYFKNNQAIAKINHSYCVSNPNHFKGYGDDAWGLTASDGPYDYSADEPIPSRDFGKIPPTGAISSFPYTPEESMKALKNYYFNYGKFLWGEYGFKDAFNLTENWCSEIYMGLNQAPMVVMIENYRTGLIWKMFMQNPEIQEGVGRIVNSE